MAKFVVIALLAGAAGAAGGVAVTWAAPAKTVDCIVRVEPKVAAPDDISKLMRPK